MSTLDVQRPDPKIVISKEANPWLVCLGIALILLFLVGVGIDGLVGSETRETSPVATNGTAAGGHDSAAPTTTTETKSVPSETLLTALLASGGVILLVGILYARINTIKLPGGGEIGLSPLNPTEKETTVAKVAEALPEGTDPKKVAEVTQVATEHLQRAKASGALEVPESKIDEVVDDSVEQTD